MFKKIALATTAASTSFFLTASSILADENGAGVGSFSEAVTTIPQLNK